MTKILISGTIIVIFLVCIEKATDPLYLTKKQSYEQYIRNHPYTLRSKSLSEYAQLPKKDRPDLAAELNFLMTVDPKLKRVPSERMVFAYDNVRKLVSERRKAPKAGREGENINLFKNGTEKIELTAIPGVNWLERGPDNVGGRTRALMWDPNDPNTTKVWAGSASGGLWFNNDITDPNSSWFAVDDFLASLSISSIAHDPNNTNIFYVGTGEGYIVGNSAGGVPGAGLYKSSDGGNNWELLNSTLGPDYRYIQKVVVTGSSTVLMTTRRSVNEGGQGGIYRSTDGGGSWTRVLAGRGADLELASNGDLYASLGFGFQAVGNMVRSTDDGLTWEDITPPGGDPSRIELAVAPSQSSSTGSTRIYAVAELRVGNTTTTDITWFQRSDDGGETWTNLIIPEYREQIDCASEGRDFTRGQAFYDLILAVKPNDADILTLGGINVLKSTDAGVNMEEVSYWTFEGNPCDDYVHADQHEAIFRPGFPNEVILGHDGGVSYSTNFGSADVPTFETRNRNYRVTQFYSVAADNVAGSDYFLAGSQDNGTQQFSEVAGSSTEEASGGDGGFTHIDQTDRAFQTTAFTFNTVNHSFNDFTSFDELIPTSDQGKGLFINPSDLDNDAHLLYSAGNNNELLRIEGINTVSPSSQESITIPVGQISRIQANAFQANRIFVGSASGSVFRIDNAHTSSPTVTNISAGISTFGFVSSIDIGSSDDQLIVTLSNYGIPSVWITSNGGDTWVNKDESSHGLPDIPVRWALFNPNNTDQVLLATELGIWSTNTIFASNPAWEPSVENLANVRCDMLQYREADGMVILATFGRGVFTSDVFASSVDTTPPTIVSLLPADNAEELLLDIDFEIRFNEPVNAGAGKVEIKRLSDHSIFESIDISATTFGVSTVQIDPTNDLEPDTDYYFTIDDGAIVDNAGNGFEGIADDTVWNFGTFDGDFPPTVAEPLEDVSLIRSINNPSQVDIDLSEVFTDQDNEDSQIMFRVAENSNPDLISSSVDGSTLTVTVTVGAIGTSMLEIEGNSNGKTVTDIFFVYVGDQVLFGQTNQEKNNQLVSMELTDFDSRVVQLADDFEVRAGETWNITGLNIYGLLNPEKTGSINSFRLELYNDANGEPDGFIPFYSATIPIPFTRDQEFVKIVDDLPELSSGNYWLSVLAIGSFLDDEWSWSLREADGNEVFRILDRDNVADLPAIWISADDLPGSFPNSDLVFEIEGSLVVATAAPGDLNANLVDGSVNLSWLDNSNNETGFEIQRSLSADGGGFEPIDTVAQNQATYVDTDSNETNEVYFYRVRALAQINSAFSNTDSVLTLPGAPILGAVEDLGVNAGFRINWTSQDGAMNFQVDVSQDNFVTFVDGFESQEVEGILLTEVLDPAPGQYQFRVRAVNDAGASVNSEIGTVEVITGIDEIAETFQVKLYPNPVENSLNIQLPFEFDSELTISVTSLDGATVLQSRIQAFENFVRLDMRRIGNGMYVITIQNQTEFARSLFMKLN